MKLKLSSNTIINWKDLEEKVLELFHSLGFKTEQNIKIKGVRSIHEVDVLAIREFAGLEFKIIVECKFWQTKVKKTQVTALYSIVSDIGAEKGVIISKVGFQKGAFEFSKTSNIELYTYDEFKDKTMYEIEMWIQHKCFDLLRVMRAEFWKLIEKYRKKADEMDTMWNPTKRGGEFTRGLAVFESKLDLIDNKEFPSYYMLVPLINEKLESDWPERVEVSSKIEYLQLLLDNIMRFKQSAEPFYSGIVAK